MHTEIIREHWHDESNSKSSQQCTSTSPRVFWDSALCSDQATQEAEFNRDHTSIKVWSDTDENRQQLWNAYKREISEEKASGLYLGFEKMSEARALPVGLKHGFVYNCSVKAHTGAPELLKLDLPQARSDQPRAEDKPSTTPPLVTTTQGKSGLGSGQNCIGVALILSSPFLMVRSGFFIGGIALVAGVFLVSPIGKASSQPSITLPHQTE